jgi:hypothetical protein
VGTGTGPNASTPFGSSGTACPDGSRWPFWYVPLVDPLSVTVMRSSITVAWFPLTALLASTRLAVLGSLPTMKCPGGAGA